MAVAQCLKAVIAVTSNIGHYGQASCVILKLNTCVHCALFSNFSSHIKCKFMGTQRSHMT